LLSTGKQAGIGLNRPGFMVACPASGQFPTCPADRLCFHCRRRLGKNAAGTSSNRKAIDPNGYTS
jgi:hypothetical protein